MHFFSSLFLISGAASSLAAAHQHSFGRDATHAHLHKRQAAGSVLVSGANGFGDNQIHSRLELNDLATNHPEQFTLLVLAMGEWQTQDTSNVTSYYQVAGIHGVPRASWDGVEACDSCTNADGYCTHVSILFPAWHRAYLALFEQELLKVVVDIANRWTGSERTVYLNAASTMRLPYWDWAAKADTNSNVLPELLSSPEVSVDGPNGRQTIANPFYQYQIPDESAMYYEPFTTWSDTVRYPTSNTASATSDDQSAVNAFNNIQPSMQQSVYQLLTSCKDYEHFSHDGATGSASCPNSLEGIHNTIHTTAGGPGSAGVSGGHMTYLPLAAFDPVFWIHHANVDRIFALWQTVNPTSYGGSQIATHNTWTIATGSEQNADSPLTPFHRDANTFWTTNSVKDWANTFKYTYPEFANSDGSQSAIIEVINALYGANPTMTASSISSLVEKVSIDPQLQISASASVTSKRALKPTKAYSPTGGWGANGTIAGPYPTGTSTSHSSPYGNGTSGQHEYSCNVRTPRFAYNTSYTVYVFLGQPSTEDSTQWLADDSFVGSLGILAGGSMHSDVIVQGAVPLTNYLQGKVKEGCLASMDKKHVTPYLQQNLNWKINREGEDIHPDTLPGYKTAVYSGVSSPHGSGSLPQWSAWQPQIDATKGKAGGCQTEEEAHNEWPAESPTYGSGATTSVITQSSTSECETPTAVPSYPAQSYPSAPVYPPTSYPTGSAPTPVSPTGGTAAPSGYAPSYPSSSPITPYTGAGVRVSGSGLLSIVSCIFAGALLF